jgi:hypothetical protein
MKTTKSIIVVVFVLLAAQMASAYYCPSTGRWLSRDPMGEPGFENFRAAAVVPRVGQIANSAFMPPARWVNRDSAAAKKDPNRYAFVLNNPIVQYDLLGLDCPGCDKPPLVPSSIWNVTSGDCALRCCAQHDQCYDQNHCDQSSWITTLAKLALANEGIPVWFTPCEQCNVNVIGCMGACLATGGNYNSNGPKYYCAKQHKFINIPGDFPTLDAAKCACCSK